MGLGVGADGLELQDDQLLATQPCAQTSSWSAYVLLRDPVDRFESVMRLRVQRGNNVNKNFAKAVSDHIWTGM